MIFNARAFFTAMLLFTSCLEETDRPQTKLRESIPRESWKVENKIIMGNSGERILVGYGILIGPSKKALGLKNELFNTNSEGNVENLLEARVDGEVCDLTLYNEGIMVWLDGKNSFREVTLSYGEGSSRSGEEIFYKRYPFNLGIQRKDSQRLLRTSMGGYVGTKHDWLGKNSSGVTLKFGGNYTVYRLLMEGYIGNVVVSFRPPAGMEGPEILHRVIYLNDLELTGIELEEVYRFSKGTIVVRAIRGDGDEPFSNFPESGYGEFRIEYDLEVSGSTMSAEPNGIVMIGE